MESIWIFLMVRRSWGARLPPGGQAVPDFRAQWRRKEYFAAGDSRDLAIRLGRNQVAERVNSSCAPASYLTLGTVAAALLYPRGQIVVRNQEAHRAVPGNNQTRKRRTHPRLSFLALRGPQFGHS